MFVLLLSVTDMQNTSISVARGCMSWCTCTPRAEKKIRRNLQGKFVSAPPRQSKCTLQVEQESILGHFLLGVEMWRVGVVYLVVLA